MHPLIFMMLPSATVLPSVCIIMPTNSRPEFVTHALARIATQNYIAPIEIVVVDDSPPELQVPERSVNASITYVRLDRQLVCTSGLNALNVWLLPATSCQPTGLGIESRLIRP